MSQECSQQVASRATSPDSSSGTSSEGAESVNPVTSLPEVNPGDVSAAASLLEKVSPEVNVDSSSDEEVLFTGSAPAVVPAPYSNHEVTVSEYARYREGARLRDWRLSSCGWLSVARPGYLSSDNRSDCAGRRVRELCLCCERPSLLCSCHFLPGAEQEDAASKCLLLSSLHQKKLFAGCGTYGQIIQKDNVCLDHIIFILGFRCHNSFLFWRLYGNCT